MAETPATGLAPLKLVAHDDRQYILDPLQLQAAPSPSRLRADALAVLADPAVRSCPLFLESSKSSQRRDLLDVCFRTIGTLPKSVRMTLESLLEQCVAVADEALRLLGRELGVGDGLVQLASSRQHRLRLIRVHGSTSPGAPEAAPMPEHADHSLLSLHIPLEGGDDPALWWRPEGGGRVELPHRPLVLFGTQLELVSGGRLLAARHGSASALPRAALVFFCEIDGDALLAPLLPPLVPLTPPVADRNSAPGAHGCRETIELARRRGIEGAPLSGDEYHLLLLGSAARKLAASAAEEESAATGGACWERADKEGADDLERTSEHFEALKAKIEGSPQLSGDEAIQARLASIRSKLERIESGGGVAAGGATGGVPSPTSCLSPVDCCAGIGQAAASPPQPASPAEPADSQADADADANAEEVCPLRRATSLMSCAGQQLPTVRLDEASIRAHWALVAALMHGTAAAPLPPLPSVAGDGMATFWGDAIETYRAWLAGVAAAGEAAPCPPPPREVRWCWLAHMLQPKAYAADTLAALGRVLPHENTMPLGGSAAEGAGAAFDAWWAEHVGGGVPYPAVSPACAARLPTLTLDWLKSLDSESVMRDEVLQQVAGRKVDFATDDAEAARVLLDYRRYVHAAEVMEASGGELGGAFGASLAPGPLTDLAWHAHMADPLAYNGDQRLRKVYLDHEPCGELNPAEMVWTDATNRVWEQLFPGAPPPSSGAYLAAGGCCCCCCVAANGDVIAQGGAQHGKVVGNINRKTGIYAEADAKKDEKSILEELSAFSKDPSKVKTKEKLAELDSYLKHQHRDVREKAFLVLAALGGTPELEERVPTIIKSFQTETIFGVRSNALRALAASKEGLSKAIAASNDEGEVIAQTAVKMLSYGTAADKQQGKKIYDRVLARDIKLGPKGIAVLFLRLEELMGGDDEGAKYTAGKELSKLVASRDKAEKLVVAVMQGGAFVQPSKQPQAQPIVAYFKEVWPNCSNVDTVADKKKNRSKGWNERQQEWKVFAPVARSLLEAMVAGANTDAVKEALLQTYNSERQGSLQNYSALLGRLRRSDPLYAEYAAKVTEVAANLRFEGTDGMSRAKLCKQQSADFVTVCTHADKMRGRFDELVQELARRTGADASQAPLKGPWRALEKMVLRPEHTPSSELDASKLCDVLRGSLVCKDFNDILQVFEALSNLDHEYGNFERMVGVDEKYKVTLIRLKCRYTAPTSGGWADLLINFSFADDPNKHVMELQVQHESLTRVRKAGHAHEKYGLFRSAFEILETLKCAPVDTYDEQAAPVATGGSAAKDASQDAEIEALKTEMSQIKIEMTQLKMLVEKALGAGGRPLSARHRDAALAEAQRRTTERVIWLATTTPTTGHT